MEIRKEFGFAGAARLQASRGERIAAAIPQSIWNVQCHDKDGNLKWEEDAHNMVFDAGINDLLDKYFKGAAYTAAWFVGLIDNTPTYNAADTMASHAGWTENVNYAEATRPALVLGAVAAKSVDNTASKAVFTINGGGGTLAGFFLCSDSGKSGTTGILYSGVNFTAGARAFIATDVLNVSATLTGA